VLAAVASGTVALAAALRIVGVSPAELAAAFWPQALVAAVMGLAVGALRQMLAALVAPVALAGLVACGVSVNSLALYLVGRERWYEFTATVRDALPRRA
jgi:hypothetical protein